MAGLIFGKKKKLEQKVVQNVDEHWGGGGMTGKINEGGSLGEKCDGEKEEKASAMISKGTAAI